MLEEQEETNNDDDEEGEVEEAGLDYFHFII